jgi:hypothetical protein
MSAKESTIQRRVKQALIDVGWHVEVLSCNAYQKGIPDLYCFRIYKGEEIHRWVDVKRPKGSTLTKHQVQKWSAWEKIGLGVWILTGEGNPDRWLMGEPNWRDWWKPRYEKWLERNPWEVLQDANDEDLC